VECRLVSFGQIEIDGRRFDHDVVIEEGHIRRRKKGPSKRHRAEYGHTPLEAADRRVQVVVRPTAEACDLLAAADPKSVAAILHVTC
jgi:hypothetical protein